VLAGATHVTEEYQATISAPAVRGEFERRGRDLSAVELRSLFDACTHPPKAGSRQGSPAHRRRDARAHVGVEAAELMRTRAAELFDRNQPCGAQANMALLLAAEASWQAANTAMQTYGGYSFASSYPIERKFRESAWSCLMSVMAD